MVRCVGTRGRGSSWRQGDGATCSGPGGLSSIPELFPGEKEKVEGVEIAQEAQAEALIEPRTAPSFLDDGSITLHLPPENSERAGGADREASGVDEADGSGDDAGTS